MGEGGSFCKGNRTERSEKGYFKHRWYGSSDYWTGYSTILPNDAVLQVKRFINYLFTCYMMLEVVF